MSSKISDGASVLYTYQNSDVVDYRLQMCVICLATDCKMYSVKEGLLLEAFKALVNQSGMSVVCWECLARLRCAARLQQRARTAQQLLNLIYQRFNNVNIENVKSLDRREHKLCSELGINTEFLNIYPQDDIKTEKEINKGDDTPPLSFDSYKPDTIGNEPLKDEANIKCETDSESDSNDDIFYDIPLFSRFNKESKRKSHRGRPKKNNNKGATVKNVDLKTGSVARSKSPERCRRKSKRKVDNSVGKHKNENKKGKVVGPRSEIEKLLSAGFTITKLTPEEQIEDFERKKENSRYLGLQYKCSSCYLGFSDESKYNNHMLRHTQEWGDYECSICKLRVQTIYRLRTHMKCHTEKYKCKQCETVTNNRSVALLHLKVHSGTPFKCPLCAEEFKHPSSYSSHKRMKHVGEFVCEQCGYTFLNEKGIFVHKNIVHKLATPALEGPHCSDCNVRFVSQEAYDRHLALSAKHSSDEKMKRLKRRDGTFSEPELEGSKLRMPITCEVPQCAAVVLGKRAYAYHFRNKHPEVTPTQFPVKQVTNNQFMCDQCGKKFQQINFLQDHMHIHSGKKSFQCEVCTKLFYTRITLLKHTKLHLATRKPYRCEECGKNFSNSGNMRRHQTIHTGLKPFKCTLCDKSFNLNEGLQLHTKHVHLNIPWPKRVRAPRQKNAMDEKMLKYM